MLAKCLLTSCYRLTNCYPSACVCGTQETRTNAANVLSFQTMIILTTIPVFCTPCMYICMDQFCMLNCMYCIDVNFSIFYNIIQPQKSKQQQNLNYRDDYFHGWLSGLQFTQWMSDLLLNSVSVSIMHFYYIFE